MGFDNFRVVSDNSWRYVGPMQNEIYNYTDYRTFLKNHVEKKKLENPNWSIGMWAKQMEISSTAVLTNILNGKRNAGSEIQKKISKYFKFNSKSGEYFSDLIRLQKSGDDPRICIAIMEKMKRNHPAGDFKLLDDTTFSAISKWYYYAIREMVALPNFREDYEWIANKLHFKVTAREIKKAIVDLLRLDLICRDASSGRLCSTNITVKTSEDLSSEGLKQFHEAMLEHAKTAIREIEVTKRDISGRTMNISEENLPRLKEYIREFRNRVSELFEENPGNRTYQLNIQLFPLCEKSETIGESNENIH